MKIISYTEARNNLRKHLDTVIDDSEPTCIVSRKNQAVLMSKSDYDSLVEMAHINSSIKARLK